MRYMSDQELIEKGCIITDGTISQMKILTEPSGKQYCKCSSCGYGWCHQEEASYGHRADCPSDGRKQWSDQAIVRLLAVHVMGGDICRSGCCVDIDGCTLNLWPQHVDGWNPLVNDSDAMALLRKMSEKGNCFIRFWNDHTLNWSVEFAVAAHCEDRSLNRAICLAALSAIGVEV